MLEQKRKFMMAFQLSAVSRFSRDHMVKPENVLEHIGFCSFYAATLTQKLMQAGYVPDISCVNNVFFKVAAHDLDEAMLGDIPRTTKYFSHEIREAFKAIETATIERIDRWLGTCFSVSWKTAKQDLSGQVLRVTDIAAVVYKNWAEIEMLGNKSFLRVATETNNYLRAMIAEDLNPTLRDELLQLKHINGALVLGVPAKSEDVLFWSFENGDEK